MSKACVYAPKRGLDTFYKLRKEFGYDKAWELYGIAINKKFLNDYRDSLSLDAEGVPSFDSLIHNDYIMRVAGSAISTLLRKNFPKREDSLDNFYLTLEDAKKFNESNSYNKYFTAVVGYDENDKLTLNLLEKTPENNKKFAEQYATSILNRGIAKALSSIGVTIGLLYEVEQSSGRVGVTDFSVANQLASDSISMIRIANNMEGAGALSEEFSHLIIGAMRDNPLIIRNINAIANEDSLKGILGNDYQDVYDFYDGNLELMAEEALGHILQEELIKKTVDSDIKGRLINNIQNKFRRIKESDISDAISEASTSMSTLAANILNGNVELSRRDITKSQRDVQFNALSDKVSRDIKILKDAIATEAKRLKIIGDNDYSRDLIDTLEGSLKKEQTKLGILTYANEALMSLSKSKKQLTEINKSTSPDRFKILRGLRMTLQSYAPFIDNLNDLANESDDLTEEITVQDHNGNKKVVNLKDILKELNSIYNNTTRQFFSVAVPAFAEYLRPVLGDEITVELGNNRGKKITIKQLLESSEGDISFLDRWLDSMGNSSDILLRAFDSIYKQAMDKARLKSIKDFRRIQALQMKAEKMGIHSYDWMFERYDDGTLTGNYIGEINYSQYYKDEREMLESLNEKYGNNPKGEAMHKKIAERSAWYESHSVPNVLGDRIPNSSYENEDYKKLSDAQKEIRKEFLILKGEMDSQYPSPRVAELKAIQLRKDGVQRFIDTAKNPSDILTNIKENLKEEFLDRADDDNLFGQRTSLTDFTGKEFMTLPVLFTNRLENPNELSTDIFGSLMAYTMASNNYNALDSIVDPLEVGRAIVADYRKVKTTRGGNHVIERFSYLGRQFENKVIESNGSRSKARLDDFFECQIYHRYFKDAGVFDVFGTKINKNKLVSWVMRGSSLATIGFNYLSNFANVANGIAMQNIEAAAGEFFSAKELAKADKIYMSLIAGNIAEINSRVKKNRLSLFDELFNIRQNFEKTTNKNMRKSLLARIFGEELAYLGQDGGDHWLYNRTAIAMALREKVIVPNKGEMSLWDALQITDTFDGNDKIKSMSLPEGTTDVNGKLFNLGKFSRKVAGVNHSLFGIYNMDDRDAAQRVIAGRLIMQYRRWMKPQFNKRFQKKIHNLDLDTDVEGYYRTFFRIAVGLVRGQYQLGAVWGELKPEEKANIRRAITEYAQLFVVLALANLVEWPDDKDRPWALKLAEYTARRMQHELGNLAPSPIMLNEMLKTVKSPAATISYVQNITNLFNSLISPSDWNNEIQSGKYKGMSTLEKNLWKSGLPGFAQYQQFSKLIYDLDTTMDYYARPYS